MSPKKKKGKTKQRKGLSVSRMHASRYVMSPKKKEKKSLRVSNASRYVMSQEEEKRGSDST
jgi:hypothetical protein